MTDEIDATKISTLYTGNDRLTLNDAAIKYPYISDRKESAKINTPRGKETFLQYMIRNSPNAQGKSHIFNSPKKKQ